MKKRSLFTLVVAGLMTASLSTTAWLTTPK